MADYLSILGLCVEDLNVPTILDLGSGPDIQFAHDMRIQFPQTTVISVDQLFIDHSPKESNLMTIGSFFTHIPLPDASVDLAVSSFAFPLYIEGESPVAKGLQEICRVLKPGGRAHLAPLAFHRRVDAGTAEPVSGKTSSTMVMIDGKPHETMLQDVTYDEHPEIFHRLFESLGARCKVEIVESKHPDCRAPYDKVLIITKSS